MLSDLCTKLFPHASAIALTDKEGTIIYSHGDKGIDFSSLTFSFTSMLYNAQKTGSNIQCIHVNYDKYVLVQYLVTAKIVLSLTCPYNQLAAVDLEAQDGLSVLRSIFV